MSKEEIEIYRRLMKERAAKGGKRSWKGKDKAERSRIMSERQKKRWARVKVPERKYVANAASVKYEDGIVYLLFGQKSVGTTTNSHLRTLVVISMSSFGTLMFLRSLDPIRAQVNALTDKPGYIPTTLPPIESEPAAPQTVALAANILTVAFSGRESVMDFYHASAFVLSQIQRGGKFAVDPVVRVFLPTALLFSVVAKLDDFKADFPTEEIETVERGSNKGGQTGEVRYGS